MNGAWIVTYVQGYIPGDTSVELGTKRIVCSSLTVVLDLFPCMRADRSKIYRTGGVGMVWNGPDDMQRAWIQIERVRMYRPGQTWDDAAQ